MNVPSPLPIAPGVVLWPAVLDPDQQAALLAEVLAATRAAPFYRPTMPGSGTPFSVEQTNFGTLGWVSDRSGYRYTPQQPLNGAPWPPIPALLCTLWAGALIGAPEPECCLVNFYRTHARMGLHQDRDEAALDVPVLSLSLGDDARFRIGGPTRKGATQSLKLSSGDMLAFGGKARLAFHGIDRVMAGSSRLIAGGGRLNLTLRRVTSTKKDARSGG